MSSRAQKRPRETLYLRSGAIVTKKILRHSFGIETCAGLYGYFWLSLHNAGSGTHPTYEESVEVGAVPHSQERANSPVRFVRAPLLRTSPEKLFEQAVNAADVILRRIKIASGAAFAMSASRERA